MRWANLVFFRCSAAFPVYAGPRLSPWATIFRRSAAEPRAQILRCASKKIEGSSRRNRAPNNLPEWVTWRPENDYATVETVPEI
jgi:hypothetical protein